MLSAASKDTERTRVDVGRTEEWCPDADFTRFNQGPIGRSGTFRTPVLLPVETIRLHLMQRDATVRGKPGRGNTCNYGYHFNISVNLKIRQ